MEQFKRLKYKVENGPFVTYGFVTVIALMYVITLLRFGTTTSVEALVASGARVNMLIVYLGEYWRLVTPIFVHIGFEHFLLNTITLYYLGFELEYIMGHWRFFLLFLIAGIGGNLMSFAFNPGAIAAGASTSLYGMFMAIIMLSYLHPESYYLRQRSRSFIILLVINLFYSLLAQNVDISGHFGGALFGAGMTYVLDIPSSYAVPKWKRAVMIGIIVLIGIILFMYGRTRGL